jgi:large subunit ribosomal protein L5
VASRLQERFKAEIGPALMKDFGYDNVMQIPKLTKVVINIGLGESIQNAKAIDAAVNDLTLITGQKPVVTKAKKSLAAFKLRAGMPIGAMVTLRGQRMYEFDGRGNYTLGLREQLMFPEIDYDRIDKTRGLEVSFVTTAKTDEEGRRLLQLLGMPFAKTEA